MIFIDSDILIDITRGKPNAIAWLNAMHPIGVVISGYSAMELIDGTQNREDMRKTQLVLHKIRAIAEFKILFECIENLRTDSPCKRDRLY